MRPTWGPPGSCRPQMGPMLAPWTMLLGRWNSHKRLRPRPEGIECTVQWGISKCIVQWGISKCIVQWGISKCFRGVSLFLHKFSQVFIYVYVFLKSDVSERSGILCFRDEAAHHPTEALKGHRVLWKIEICYLIRIYLRMEAYVIRMTK